LAHRAKARRQDGKLEWQRIGNALTAQKIFAPQIIKCVSISALDVEGRTIWIVDAHRDDGRRFIVADDDKLSRFVELERQV